LLLDAQKNKFLALDAYLASVLAQIPAFQQGRQIFPAAL